MSSCRAACRRGRGHSRQGRPFWPTVGRGRRARSSCSDSAWVSNRRHGLATHRLGGSVRELLSQSPLCATPSRLPTRTTPYQCSPSYADDKLHPVPSTAASRQAEVGARQDGNPCSCSPFCVAAWPSSPVALQSACDAFLCQIVCVVWAGRRARQTPWSRGFGRRQIAGHGRTCCVCRSVARCVSTSYAEHSVRRGPFPHHTQHQIPSRVLLSQRAAEQIPKPPTRTVRPAVTR